MSVHELIEDLIWRYMRIGEYWHILSYLLTILFAIVLVKYSKNRGGTIGRSILSIILFLYLITIYISTVVTRWNKPEITISIHPFLSWSQALSGDKDSMMMVIENMIMLMPIGFFLPFIDKSKQYFLRTICFGFGFSLFIEVSQYISKRGLFEIDDLFNNTLGVIISCFLTVLYKNFVKKVVLYFNLNVSVK